MIKSKVNGYVGTICLNRIEKHNALCEELVQQFLTALSEFSEKNVRCVILRAPSKSKVWCAGHDIDELPTGGGDPLGWRDPLRKIVREIQAYQAPIIAMVEGSVWGGGCEVVFACDMIIAEEKVTFAATPAKMSVPYNASGLMTFLNTDNLRLCKEMLFTAAPVPASRLYDLGLINHIIASHEIEDFTYELAHRICDNAPLAIAVMKEQLRVLSGAHAMQPESFERIQGIRRVVYNSEDYREGIRAFKEKRKPVFKGR